jgi:hypothetical protein
MPTLASTSRAQMAFIPESAFGLTPGSGTPKDLRMTGESLDYGVTTKVSDEIRDDRQKTDLALVGAGAKGGLNFELSYNEYDSLLEAALQGTWAAFGTNGVGATFTADFTATTITASEAPTGTSAFTGLVKGQWFKLSAPSHANDGLYCRVSESVAPTSTVITLSALTPLATGTGVTLCKVATSRLTNGVVQRSFTLEKEFADIAQFFAYRGMTASKLSLALQSGSLVTGSFDFMGKDVIRAGATTLPNAPTASTAYGIMNAVTGVGQIMEGGALLTSTYIKALNLDVDNSLRGRTAIGTLGNVSLGSGDAEIAGNIEVYLADGTLYDKFVNNTETSLSFRMVDGAGNGYVVTLPRVKYGDAKVNAGAADQDAMLSLPFTALKDADAGTGKMILIDRVGVAVA